MSTRNTLLRRLAVTATAAAALSSALTPPASATAIAVDPADDWGTIVPNAGCSQADAWANRLKGAAGLVDTTLFEAHSPPIPSAPEQYSGGSKIINFTNKEGVGLGVASGYAVRAMSGKLPAGAGAPDVAVECAAYADATFATIDVGVFPYAASPLPGGTQLSPAGVHLESPTIEAQTQPGSPVKLSGGAAAGYISSFGAKIVNVPKLWPVNFGVRIPADYNQAAIASVYTNEQVTTDSNGRPTLGPDGRYKMDPQATSGYVNAIHISALVPVAADFTWGHVAVLRGAGGVVKPTCVTVAVNRCGEH